MCACRQKKSFLIEDILGDTKKKPYKNLSNEPSKPLVCTQVKDVEATRPEKDQPGRDQLYRDQPGNNPLEREQLDRDQPRRYQLERGQAGRDQPDSEQLNSFNEKLTRFNVISEVQHEMEMSKVNLDQRRNTFPLYPMPVKPSYPWNYKKDRTYIEPRLSYYSEQMLNNSQLLRNQLAANRFVSQSFAIRQAYGFDRVPANCCTPWWGIGGRRKGGQVRFTASQTGALERRFNASKYLSPDERRALANTLRLSDRQVKTWFQNRRAKWRRTTPDSADAGSPSTSGDGSDDDVNIADDDI